jgi:hypothetical protein
MAEAKKQPAGLWRHFSCATMLVSYQSSYRSCQVVVADEILNRTNASHGSERPRGCQSLWHRGADGFRLDGCWRCTNGGEVSAAHAFVRGALSPCAGDVDGVHVDGAHVVVCEQRSSTCPLPLLLADCAACLGYGHVVTALTLTPHGDRHDDSQMASCYGLMWRHRPVHRVLSSRARGTEMPGRWHGTERWPSPFGGVRRGRAARA